MQQETKPRPLSVKEAGRKGGITTRERLGREHYQRIGALGAAKANANHRELVQELAATYDHEG